MDLVEAAVRTGRRQEAAAHVAAIREARIAEISPRLALLATASAAIAAPACQAGLLFDQALGIPGVARWPFEVARVQLAYGEHLRRARATGDARTHLGAALATFRALGARPWADRAANELRATRMTVVKTQAHRPPVLTAQEHQIASLAAAGLTNKQIGQRLYLSHRTVSAHLYRVFPKLGISTRAGLRDALVALVPPDPEPWRCSRRTGENSPVGQPAAGGADVTEPPVTFAGVLRRLRTGVQLTQEELARVAGLSVRAVSDLERGVATTPHRDTVRLLADALQLIGPVRAEFEAAARGPACPAETAAGGVAAATRTLPRDVASFTGRHEELRELVDAAAGADRVVSIYAIGGMAGVGKTAFAVHAAHRLAERFPAGQIFLPLHGHTPGQQPVDPGDALASLLLTIGVPAGQIPLGLEARTALWRDQLVSLRLLLVLDNAVGSEQVQPLLPGAGDSLVLVTSRRHLTALEDATAISLDTLAPGEAAALLVRLAARPGLSLDDAAVGEDHPALRLPAAGHRDACQAVAPPPGLVAGRAGRRACRGTRPAGADGHGERVGRRRVRLVVLDLAADQQLLFRRLGLHPGTESTATLPPPWTAPAWPPPAAAWRFSTTSTAGRGRPGPVPHARPDPAACAHPGRPSRLRARSGAGHSGCSNYQHTAALAESLLARRTVPALPAGTTSTPVPVLADREQALAWARAERASLLACLDHAVAGGQHARVVALTAGLAGLCATMARGPTPSPATPRPCAPPSTSATGSDRLTR